MPISCEQLVPNDSFTLSVMLSYIFTCFLTFVLSYRAAEMRHGWWSPPYFDCGGFVEKWVVTYSAPFFGWDSLKTRLQFK